MKAKIVFIVLLVVSNVTYTDVGLLIEQLPKIEFALRGLVTIFSLKSTSVGREFLMEHWKIILSFTVVVSYGIKKYSDWRAEQKKISNDVGELDRKTDLMRDELSKSSSEIKSRLTRVGSNVTSLQKGQSTIKEQLVTLATREQVAELSKLQQAHQASITRVESLTQKTQNELKRQGQELKSELTEIGSQQITLNKELQTKLRELEEKIGEKIDAVGENGKKLLTMVSVLREEFSKRGEEMASLSDNVNSSSEKVAQLIKEMVSIKQFFENQNKQSAASNEKIDALFNTLCKNSTSANFMKSIVQDAPIPLDESSIRECNVDFD